jgi:hypothetical protein
LIIVGIPANKSARIAKISDIIPFLVTTQIIIAMNDSAPHRISNLVILQYEFLLKKEATTISKGENPAVKVEASNGRLIPDLYPTYTATRGARDQNIHVTLLGRVFP